jgi:hypothetical protein
MALALNVISAILCGDHDVAVFCGLEPAPTVAERRAKLEAEIARLDREASESARGA